MEEAVDVKMGVKYRLDLEVDGGRGGCKGVCKILTRPRCRWMRSQPGITRPLVTAVKVKV